MEADWTKVRQLLAEAVRDSRTAVSRRLRKVYKLARRRAVRLRQAGPGIEDAADTADQAWLSQGVDIARAALDCFALAAAAPPPPPCTLDEEDMKGPDIELEAMVMQSLVNEFWPSMAEVQSKLYSIEQSLKLMNDLADSELVDASKAVARTLHAINPGDRGSTELACRLLLRASLVIARSATTLITDLLGATDVPPPPTPPGAHSPALTLSPSLPPAVFSPVLPPPVSLSGPTQPPLGPPPPMPVPAMASVPALCIAPARSNSISEGIASPPRMIGKDAGKATTSSASALSRSGSGTALISSESRQALDSRIAIDEALQGSLVLEGPLRLEGRTRWFTNRDAVHRLEFRADSQTPDSDGSIDLSHVTSVRACGPRGRDHGSRALCIEVMLRGGQRVILEAHNERDATFWLLGLTRIVSYTGTQTVFGVLRGDEATVLAPLKGGDWGVSIEYEFLNTRMEEAIDALGAIEPALRAAAERGEKLFEQYMGLARRKAALARERDAIGAALHRIETLSNGISKRSAAPLPHQDSSLPGWAQFRSKKREAPVPLVAGAPGWGGPRGSFDDWMSKYARLQRWRLSAVAPADTASLPGISGPAEEVPFCVAIGDCIAAKVVTAYPLSENGLRQMQQLKEKGEPVDVRLLSHLGDPVCDQLVVKVLGSGRAVFALADGCNWGSAPREAARRASTAFVEFCCANSHKLVATDQAGDLVAMALSYAQDRVLSGHKLLWECGTTTIISGLIMEMSRGEQARYALVLANVGDCKVFKYSARLRTMEDLTPANRNLTDPTDPGGRLGPQCEGEPDLRNLSITLHALDDNDLVLAVSDGVHDNFDPQNIGEPHTKWSLPGESWDDAAQRDPEMVGQVKTAYRCSKLKSAVFLGAADDTNCPSPAVVVERIVSASFEMTKASRVWLEEHPKEKLPVDHVMYPGKQDHVSCVCIRVGQFPTLAPLLSPTGGRVCQ